jgi:hypothetical protein
VSFEMEIDDHGLSTVLGLAALQVGEKAVKAVTKSAVSIKKTMRDDASRSRWFRIAPQIGYDQFTADGSGLTAEIGPQRRGAGHLAGIAYFGGAHGGGGTIRDPKAAAEAEAPRFEKALADIMEGILE